MMLRKYVGSTALAGMKTCRFHYRRRFSTTNTAAASQAAEDVDRKELILWQLKLSAYFAGAAVSVYGAYVIISSGFQLEYCRRKFSSHWHRLYYGNTLPKKVQALLNSRFNACLSPELLKQLSIYFIKFDIAKDNGIRRRDVTLFLESVGIETTNSFVERFIATGVGETKEHRLVSGCSLQEFADLLEILVLEDRLRGGSQLEGKLIDKLKDYNGDEGNDTSYTPSTFRLGNPLLSGAAKDLSQELSKYIKRDIEDSERQELQNELERNYRLRDKLKAIAKARKLSKQEARSLDSTANEIELLEKELAKQRHTQNLLWFM